MKELKMIPNFFMSQTYLNQKSIEFKKNADWMWLEEEGLTLFPPLPINTFCKFTFPIKKIWVDFEFSGVFNGSIRNMTKEFFDWEYIYDPKNFLDLSGKKWKVFRKNLKKWPNRNPGWSYSVFRDERKVHKLFVDWIERHQTDLQDYEFISNCILHPKDSDYTRYLYNNKRQLIAINYADMNYKYINYRFLICKKEPFVDEFMRYCFYTDRYIHQLGKLVNDGGSLNILGLEKLKNKLNPIEKRKRYSWK